MTRCNWVPASLHLTTVNLRKHVSVFSVFLVLLSACEFREGGSMAIEQFRFFYLQSFLARELARYRYCLCSGMWSRGSGRLTDVAELPADSKCTLKPLNIRQICIRLHGVLCQKTILHIYRWENLRPASYVTDSLHSKRIHIQIPPCSVVLI